jgi:hypothetical protein
MYVHMITDKIGIEVTGTIAMIVFIVYLYTGREIYREPVNLKTINNKLDKVIDLLCQN